jgi:hypothetical protein
MLHRRKIVVLQKMAKHANRKCLEKTIKTVAEFLLVVQFFDASISSIVHW